MDNDDLTLDETQPLIQNSINDDIIFEENRSCLKESFDPRKKSYRYFCLIFICFMCFGSYFCYVLPGAIESQLEKSLRITTTQFTAFNSLYSWP